MIVRSTSNNIRENIFSLYIVLRENILSITKKSQFRNQGWLWNLSPILFEREYFFLPKYFERIPGSDFRATFFLVTKLTLFGDSQEYL